MKIELLQAGRRFNREWIFRNATLSFSSDTSYAITGPNGSGKSTLLQCLAGMLRLSEGKIRYRDRDQEVPEEQTFRCVSFCAPYLELIEEMNLVEFLDFHRSFKPFINDFSTKDIIRIIGLEKSADKQIRYYSSGMKQRVKLAQAILSDTGALFLDEPCTNLDAAGIDLYHSMITEYGSGRLIVVSSNDETEYRFCTGRIRMQELK
jgi:ABC-type multidrug transport system ATPase subunit